jgi:hypothetical protein
MLNVFYVTSNIRTVIILLTVHIKQIINSEPVPLHKYHLLAKYHTPNSNCLLFIAFKKRTRSVGRLSGCLLNEVYNLKAVYRLIAGR